MKPNKKKTNTDIWTHFILEAFCGYEFMRYKTMSVAPMPKNIKNFFEKNYKLEYKRIKNNSYIDAKPCDTPNNPHPDKCLRYEQKHRFCPFFLWASVEEDEYKTMLKAWKKTCY